ncbi:MAG: hypothetical protein IAE98_06045 [Candidatus Kapabacteria bacterium]|nr:hypothetical protein [Candidatus Kapabacteria bacterium]
MRVKRNGHLWDSNKVADYLGISERTATVLMENNEIPSFYLLPDQKARTTKSLVKFYIRKLNSKAKNESGLLKIQDCEESGQ